ncbi:hypothetical protein [Streptomyces sp. NBC_00057]|uniref:hypothetical protein n=1 Tax=Streptomyces sp. NBC_00057 TaxID=2975634 RepID=UPI002F919633
MNWTQTARVRRLEFVLRPFTERGWDADTITAELHSWMLTWRPARPAEYIRARLAQQATAEHQGRLSVDEVRHASTCPFRENASGGYQRALAAHRQAAQPRRVDPTIEQAAERQMSAVRELSRRAFPETEAVPQDALAPIEDARAQRRQAAATEAAALRRGVLRGPAR